jgi:hypothetical protein
MYENWTETKEEIDCRYRRRYANNGNKTVDIKKEQNGRESLRRLKPIVDCSTGKRRR